MLVAIFATVVCVVQQLEGTSAYFSLCSFTFIVLAGVAFNIAGGLTRISGSYIFFYSILAAILAWVIKDVVGEAADSNLAYPNITAGVYVGTMLSMTVAAFLSKKLVRKKPILETFLTEDNVRTSVIGCAVIGFAATLSLAIFPHGEGTFLSFLAQVNNFSLLAIVIGVSYEVRLSGGTRSLSPIIVAAMATPFIFDGLFRFTKEGMFTPLLAYIVAAACAGYRFTNRQVVVYGIILMFLLYYMVPYSQYARSFRSQDDDVRTNFFQNIDTSVRLLSDLNSLRAEYLKGSADAVALDNSAGYFNNSQGIFDRFNMLKPDDGLIGATEEGRNTLGLFPLLYAVYGAVPHFLWPDKPFYYIGNLYAHEVGTVGEDDYSTGISYSPGGEAYHMARWLGVFLVAPCVFLLVFTFFDSLCGDTRKSPWGLVGTAYFAHVAPEGMLGGSLTSIWHFGLPLIGAALVCAYVMPIIGALIVGPQKKLQPLHVDVPPRRAIGRG